MGDEFKEWRRTGTVTDLFNREIVKDELQEYLCKMRGYSYRRCKWISTEEIEDDGPLSSNILKKFQKKVCSRTNRTHHAPAARQIAKLVLVSCWSIHHTLNLAYV